MEKNIELMIKAIFKYKLIQNNKLLKIRIIGGNKMNKKGFVSMHAGIWFVVGIIIGAAAVYYLATKGLIPGI